ncbi:MAG TPA: 2-isopropylmalate synthase [Steroidobacteraceae bacterium]|jgi:2-isopropylmalate synthase|nr:2-isopropylmalate synthase [Steroidobacteraceae bacterium]
MLVDPQRKYRSFRPVDLPDRHWPAARITRAPIWLSTDLRDGNQALFEPMSAQRKQRFFRMLCDIGFREIEVGFPSASQIEFDFIRSLVEQDQIPPDVTIGVLTPAREELIARTVESLVGARRAIVHVYNASSKAFQQIVFGMQPAQVVDMAVRSVSQVRRLTDRHPETEWVLQYSPEHFTDTDLSFSREICDAVTEAWGATPQRKVILNLPATVEMATPNVYADQIEWMHRQLARRDSVVLSVHPHNDRGTAVAAAELAQMAGADRVEGCLFGNGERTGNVDVVTLALNLYTQGVHPGLDFSDIGEIARTVEYCNQLPIHPRHPYAGDLVFTAFSGSHQDGIKKGMAMQDPNGPWRVPYLPIDPKDLGRTYDSIIRINSQSGKGGVAYLLEHDHGMVLPRRLQVEFSSAVQRQTDVTGSEMSSEALWQLFEREYLQVDQPLQLVDHHLEERDAGQAVRLTIRTGAAADGQVIALHGAGNGPLDAVVAAMRLPFVVQSYEERAIGTGADARAAAYIELTSPASTGSRFGVAIHPNIITASIQALFCAFNRILAAMDTSARETLLGNLRAVQGLREVSRRSA